ncbi:unnamed protein product [Rhizoctonia solani]|uniref:NmrA-like domain-containing protein n=1 Tax=Rhizoctonia solani TaxID=456999 RepID=A0A8H3DVE1_9AGAM|nr:unnamed protein product [Rhizoctonia solani]
MIPLVRNYGERPCSACGGHDKGEPDTFFLHCCICDRFWHNACLYTRVPKTEILRRNKRALGSGWKDWKCRQCRGVGPEGRMHRPAQNAIELVLIDDDEIQVLPPPATNPPARRASTLPPPRSGPTLPVPLSRRQDPPRPPPPHEVIELDDDDDIIEIPPPTRRPLQDDVAPEPRRPIEVPNVSIQDEPMLDLDDLSLEERPPTPPPPGFPSFAEQVDIPECPFGPIEGTLRPSPSLPPALRASSRTALGQRMQDIIASDRLVQNLGLKGLKAAGWKTEKRERIASVEPPVIPPWAKPPNDKGKGRDPRERRPRPITELRLRPPRPRTTENSLILPLKMKVVLVVGATGQQGNAVIRAMSDSENYLCLALTRKLQSPKAQKLRSLRNVKLVSGDLNDVQQLRTIFEDAKSATTGAIWGVFVALAFPGLGKSAEGEERQGKNIAVVSQEFQVQSYIYSSVIPFFPEDNPPPPGLDRYCKMIIEKHVSTLNLPWTIIRPGFFMENFSSGMIGRLTDATLRYCVPPEYKIQFTAVNDIGRLSRVVFDNPTEFIHKTMDIAGESLTSDERSQAFIRATGYGMPSVPWLLISIIYWLNPTVRDIVEEFIQADNMRRKDPRGYDGNLCEAASHVKLTSFEEWARNWNQITGKEANQQGVTLWGMLTGKA